MAEDYRKVLNDALAWVILFVGKLSPKVAVEILTLIELLKAKETPVWVKGMIAGALAYAVLPIDLIPDFLPLAGLTDDAGVIGTTIITVMKYIRPQMREAAQVEYERLTKKT